MVVIGGATGPCEQIDPFCLATFRQIVGKKKVISAPYVRRLLAAYWKNSLPDQIMLKMAKEKNDKHSGVRRRIGSLLSGLRGHPRLLVLCYHRVFERTDPMYTGDVNADEFVGQMRALLKYFKPIQLGDAVNHLMAGTLPASAVSVTFDDGYADNYNVALPILEDLGIPATVFVASGFVDGGRMWNDTVVEALRRSESNYFDATDLGLGKLPTRSISEKADSALRLILRLRRMPGEERDARAAIIGQESEADLPQNLMLTSRQLQEMHERGVEIGAHTVSHPILSRIDADTARKEIEHCKATLERLTGAEVCGFAYPNGKPGVDYEHSHVRFVAEAGFNYAVSTARGTAAIADERYEIPRLDPWDKAPSRFIARLMREFLRTPEGAFGNGL